MPLCGPTCKIARFQAKLKFPSWTRVWQYTCWEEFMAGPIGPIDEDLLGNNLGQISVLKRGKADVIEKKNIFLEHVNLGEYEL